jgi:hypothetical protein
VQCSNPCGGGVEYLHRDPASCKRRRKRKFKFWDSKIWSRVPRDSDLRQAALARASSIYKRQTHPLVREGAPVINIWSWGPDGARHQDLLTDWQSVVMWLWLWVSAVKYSEVSRWAVRGLLWAVAVRSWLLRHGDSSGTQSKGNVFRWSRYQATTGEDTADWEDLMRAAVNCRVCKLAIAL